jgi:DNA polymerase-3 subunit beta
MQVLIDATAFQRTISAAARAAASRPTGPLPILRHLLLDARDGQLAVTGTDLEFGLTLRVPASVHEPGQTTAQASLLADIAAHLPDQPVSLSTHVPSTLAIATQTLRVELVTAPAADYPSIPMPTDAPSVQLPASALRTLIRRTRHAASKDETRPFLTGVYLELGNTLIALTATDGGRLAHDEAAIESGPPTPLTALIPARSAAEWDRLLAQLDDTPVSLWIQQSAALLSTPSLTSWSRLIAGSFPSYKHVIPAAPSGTITAPTQALLSAARRALITARDSARIVTLTPAQNAVQLSSSTPEVGAATDTVPAEIDGEPCEVRLNGQYLLDALSALDSPSTKIEISGPLAPVAIRPQEPAPLVHVIAPVRVPAAAAH